LGVVVTNTALIMLIGVINADRTASGTVLLDDGKQTLVALKQCVRLAAADVVGLYLRNDKSPYREPLLAESAEIVHGAAFVCQGQPGDKVFVQVAAAGDFVRSTRAPSREEIVRWRRNVGSVYSDVAHNVANSPLSPFHWVENKRLYYTGNSAKIWLPAFTYDPTSDALKADEVHTGLVVSRSVFYAHKEGYASDWLFAKHDADYQAEAKLVLTEGRDDG
jgi:hypothetical protein